MNGWSITTATEDCLPAICDIVAACNEQYRDWAPAGYTAPEKAVTARVLWERLHIPGVIVRVASRRRIEAFACWWPVEHQAGDGELSSLFVAPSAQGQGAGRLLLCDTAAMMRAGGLSRMLVWAPQANERVLRYYETHGFALTGATRTSRQLGLALLELARPLRP